MDITAIITCKNRDINISYCLASIHVSLPRPATILVDFGSNVSLEYYQDQYSWLKVIRVTRNTDVFHKSRAINIGIRSVKTKYLCISDADEVFQQNFFGCVEDALEENYRSFVMCHTYVSAKHPDFSADQLARDPNLYNKLMELAKSSKVKPYGEGCCNGVATQIILNMGGYDERYIGYAREDSDMWARAKMNKMTEVWVHSRTSMIHLPHPKQGKYYSKESVARNDKVYQETRKNRLLVANKGKNWGCL
jgi:glycosyltransferase involved in cell wall biosynthesis